jgi:ATP-dependent 26S proteasome regulatory subunit
MVIQSLSRLLVDHDMLSRTDLHCLLIRLVSPIPVSLRLRVADSQLKAGVRVSLDMTTLTIMRILPREVDPMVRTRSRRLEQY